MKKFIAAMLILTASATTAAAEPRCRQGDDTGKSLCVAGVLYRCACREVAGATVCSWNNAASACSALTATESDAPRHVVGRVDPTQRR
jgi:hypothetical protein